MEWVDELARYGGKFNSGPKTLLDRGIIRWDHHGTMTYYDAYCEYQGKRMSPLQYYEALCYHGAWVKETPSYNSTRKLLEPVRLRFVNWKLARSALKRVLKHYGVHKDIVPIIVAVVDETKNDAKVWGFTEGHDGGTAQETN